MPNSAEPDFDTIIRDIKPYVTKNVRYIVKNYHDIEDVVQEVLIKIVRFYHKYDPNVCKFEYWVSKITKNQCIDYLRRIKRADDIDNWQDTLYTSENIQETVENAEIVKEVHKNLGKIPEKYKQPFLLRHVNCMSHEEISATLSIPVNNVKTHIHRAKKAVQKRMNRYHIA